MFRNENSLVLHRVLIREYRALLSSDIDRFPRSDLFALFDLIALLLGSITEFFDSLVELFDSAIKFLGSITKPCCSVTKCHSINEFFNSEFDLSNSVTESFDSMVKLFGSKTELLHWTIELFNVILERIDLSSSLLDFL